VFGSTPPATQNGVDPAIAHVAAPREYANASWLIDVVGVTVQLLGTPPDASVEAKIPEPPTPMHIGFVSPAVQAMTDMPDDVVP
jgi:hypothetical protein